MYVINLSLYAYNHAEQSTRKSTVNTRFTAKMNNYWCSAVLHKTPQYHDEAYNTDVKKHSYQ